MIRYCYDCCKLVTYTEDTYGNTVCPICRRIIETATDMAGRIDPIITIIGNKRDMARHSEHIFDEKNYTWIIGINIFKILRDNLSGYPEVSLYIDDFGNGAYLMGIRLMVDVCNPHRISLLKEV